MTERRFLTLLAPFLLVIGSVHSTEFSKGPTTYKPGDPLNVEAYKLVSPLTLLTYGYYDLPFCRPDPIKFNSKGYGKNRLNIMETSSTLYKINFSENISCEELKAEEKSCTRTYTREELALFVDLITKKYRSHLIFDGVPASIFHINPKTKKIRYEAGIPLGAQGLDGTIYLYNHLDFIVHYGRNIDGLMFIDSVEVTPGTIDEDDYDAGFYMKPKCYRGNPLVIGKNWKAVESKRIQWTYKVEWVEEKKVPISGDRISRYGMENTFNVRWMSTFNTIIVSLFAFLVMAIFLSYVFNQNFTLNIGISHFETMKGSAYGEGEVKVARYNSRNDNESDNDSSSFFDDDDYDDDSTGKNKDAIIWKYLVREMMTIPRYPLVLSILVGVGLQGFVSLCCMVCAYMVDSAEVGNVKHLISVFCTALCTIGPAISGFFTGRLCKTFKVRRFVISISLNMVVLPVALLCFSAILQESYKYFTPFIAMLNSVARKLVWMSPVTGICHCIGRRLPPMCTLRPERKKRPKEDDECSCILSPLLNNMITGAFPFGAKFLGVFFIIATQWSYQVMDVGSLSMNIVMATFFVCFLMNISTVCFLLSPDVANSWWWSSFKTDGFSTLYIVLFVVIYYKRKVTFSDGTSKAVYFTYTLFVIIIHYVMSAATSFILTFAFVRKLSSQKSKQSK